MIFSSCQKVCHTCFQIATRLIPSVHQLEITIEERDFEPKAPFHHNDTWIWEAMGAQRRFKLK